MSKNAKKTASVLAFERKLDPSDALMYSGNWEDRDNDRSWSPIVIREKSVRGTISNRLKSSDQTAIKVDAAIQNPNLQTVDVATLPHDADTVRVNFTLRVLGGAGTPSACNESSYRERLDAVVNKYVEEVGFNTLAQRYAYNLANGRFLWRNRMGAEQVEVRVTHLVQRQAANAWTFDSLSLSLRDFSSENDGVREIAALIDEGLRGDKHVLLRVEAFARLGGGQEVFPSQELILDTQSSKKSKTLYHVSDIAGMHSQKIGNAIRTIDTWYPTPAGREDMVKAPIALEPYGSVTTEGRAYRQPKQKQDFYNLLDGWINEGTVPPVEQQNYVMGILIRGGVFGDSSK